MSFEMMGFDNDKYAEQFGDLADVVKQIKQNSIDEAKRFEEQQEESLNKLNAAFGTENATFEDLDAMFEEALQNQDPKDKEDLEVKYVKTEELKAVTEEEMKERYKKLTDVSGDFNINTFKEGDKAMTPEEKRLSEERTQKAIDMGMPIETTDGKRGDPFSNSSKNRLNGGVERKTAGGKFFGETDFTNSNFGSPTPPTKKTFAKTNKRNNANETINENDSENEVRLKKFNNFFNGINQYVQHLGTQRVKGWREDKVREEQELKRMNRGVKSPVKRMVNRMKAFARTKRFRMTMKVATLMGLNLSTAILTKQVEFENVAQMLMVLGISVTTFYLSRELTEDGLALRV